jgi:hypothetical protein
VATSEALEDQAGLLEEVHESREAGIVVLAVITSQAVVAILSLWQGWMLWVLPGSVWIILIVPEFVLGLTYTIGRPGGMIEQLGIRREVGLAMITVVVLADAGLVVALLASLVTTNQAGLELLIKGLTVWLSNVVAFGLAFWTLDQGGPVRRIKEPAPLPEFLFPQTGSPALAPGGWRPHLVDYLYVAFTNAIAFSPTDTLPLSHRMKVLMFVEASMSAATVLLVVARAVNVFR